MNANGSRRTIEILLVEDSPGDVRLTVEALKEGKVRNSLHVVSDGVQAMSFLRHAPPYAEMPHPDLVLLDLNLPKKDGREVLEEIKKDPHLRRLPIVVLTTSDAEIDVLKAYDLYANCYIKKPVELESFIRVVKSIESFWVEIVKLPPN